jgi:hypothetical protein
VRPRLRFATVPWRQPCIVVSDRSEATADRAEVLVAFYLCRSAMHPRSVGRLPSPIRLGLLPRDCVRLAACLGCKRQALLARMVSLEHSSLPRRTHVSTLGHFEVSQ